jgi:hypothetical protein
MEIAKLNFSDRDEFKRKAIAEKVITLLASGIDVSPMVIDGGWGTGKTEFCFKLINLMKTQNSHELIYVDAFQADHADEPMLTVLAEVIKLLPTPEAKVAFTKKIIPAARYGLKTIAKGAIAHILKQDTDSIAEGFDKEIQQVADKAIDSTVESLLKDHVDASKNLLTLQITLKELAQKKPIIIFIDELDRCRPSFAVDMLEIIKHVFDIEGVSFVLITNTQQLKASINHCYGDTVDAQRYLDKFVKFRFELNSLIDSTSHRPSLVSRNHFFSLVKVNKCLPDSCINHSIFCKVVEQIIQYHNFSLREVETLVRHINILKTLSSSEQFFESEYMGYNIIRFLSVLFVCFRPEILIAINKGIVDPKPIGEFLGITEISRISKVNKPKPLEVMMVILSKDYTVNRSEYYLEPEHQTEWNEFIQRGFIGDVLDPQEAINEIKKTAAILALG